MVARTGSEPMSTEELHALSLWLSERAYQRVVEEAKETGQQIQRVTVIPPNVDEPNAMVLWPLDSSVTFPMLPSAVANLQAAFDHGCAIEIICSDEVRLGRAQLLLRRLARVVTPQAERTVH
jgi:hypothetical protein